MRQWVAMSSGIVDRVRELFDVVDGCVVRKSGNVRGAKYAGTRLDSGRIVIGVKHRGKVERLYAHQVTWMLYTGEDPRDGQISHMDGNCSNNCFENLRFYKNSGFVGGSVYAAKGSTKFAAIPVQIVREKFELVGRDLVWRTGYRGTTKAGEVAGGLTQYGYRSVAISVGRGMKRKYLAHRLAWVVAYGEDPGDLEIDHMDGDRTNNSIGNLRKVTCARNSVNIHSSRGSGTGPLGVVFRSGTWYAKASNGGNHKWLGAFLSARAAAEAYWEHRKIVDAEGALASAGTIRKQLELADALDVEKSSEVRKCLRKSRLLKKT